VVDEMLAAGLRRPHQVVSNPIDTQLFRPASPERRVQLKWQLGFSDATILYAGRLAIEKNIDVLVRALPAVLRQVPHAMLALAGHGTAREQLVLLARELGVADRVKFLGTLAAPALAEAYRAADVFAIASTSETQSMVLLQAMSSGLPAVGARSRALPEYISGDTGLLAEPGDAAAFAQHLASLLRDGALRERMGACAARRAQGFAVGAVIDTWEGIYASTACVPQSTTTRPLGAS
jgi:glycosyltransferase involved in cell wall biosynthesis